MRRSTITILRIVCCVIVLLDLVIDGCRRSDKGYFADSENEQEYRTVKIGKQTWMAENLNNSHRVNEFYDCYDKYDSNCKKYGSLYTWADATTACPNGWHLPNREEWNSLMVAVGGVKVTSINDDISIYRGVGKKLKSKTGWKRVNILKTGNGTDKLGFSAVPSGIHSYYMNNSGSVSITRDTFYGAGYDGNWWSATEYCKDSVYYCGKAYGWHVSYDINDVYESYFNKRIRLSVRCVKDRSGK